jgi:hypothetical protein
MTYQYEAKFDRPDYRIAVGEVEADSVDEAEDAVYGMCGTWYDDDGAFQAGCPDSVRIIQ